MSTELKIGIGLLLPLLGTTLGAAMVFLIKKEINEKFQKMLLGFAAGVMIAASIWSLIIPATQMIEGSKTKAALIVACGIAAGFILLLLLDVLIPHMHVKSSEEEGPKSNWKKSTKMFFAVTLHNIPEGMAIGVVFAGVLQENAHISLIGALTLAIGIAIQNFPEGAIVSIPLEVNTKSKKKSFLLGFLSGIVEPIAAIITILLSALLVPALPFLLAFAAGAMLYVVIEELIPESQQGRHSNIATIGAGLGFILMMVLDIVFG